MYRVLGVQFFFLLERNGPCRARESFQSFSSIFREKNRMPRGFHLNRRCPGFPNEATLLCRCRATRSECIECPSHNGPCARFSGLKRTALPVYPRSQLFVRSPLCAGGIHLTGCVGWKRDAYFLSPPDPANKILSSSKGPVSLFLSPHPVSSLSSMGVVLKGPP